MAKEYTQKLKRHKPCSLYNNTLPGDLHIDNCSQWLLRFVDNQSHTTTWKPTFIVCSAFVGAQFSPKYNANAWHKDLLTDRSLSVLL